MSGQSSADTAGTAESVAAGCSLRELPRKRDLSQRQAHDLDSLLCFTWGRGEDGQLGLGDTSDQDTPTYVSFCRGRCFLSRL